MIPVLIDSNSRHCWWGTTEIFCGAEQHRVGLHSHILKILDLCCEVAETQLEYVEISKYSRQIKCQNSRCNTPWMSKYRNHLLHPSLQNTSGWSNYHHHHKLLEIDVSHGGVDRRSHNKDNGEQIVLKCLINQYVNCKYLPVSPHYTLGWIESNILR